MAKKHRHARSHRHKRRHDMLAFQPAPGASPGALVAHPGQLPTQLTLMRYDATSISEPVVTSLEQIKPHCLPTGVTWLNVTGLADIALIEQIGAHFGLHRLVLEDVTNPGHRSKVEDYDNYIFIIIKAGIMGEQFETEQLSFVMMPNLVITFQEKPSDIFALVIDRIRKASGRIRTYGADYLTYALLDTIVDGYYPILETLNQKLEAVENDLLNISGKALISRIYNIKSDLLYLHRAIWPMRDIINMLSREDSPIIQPNTLHYLRDCHDQVMQVTELSEFYRDIASGLMNTFLAYSGHKMNEIMKVLTMISAIFIPLSFIAGIYGMNFEHMPELRWEYGYGFALGLMTVVSLIMLWSFRRRGWLGRTHIHDEAKK